MTKKSLLVGINYTTLSSGNLRGCINDVNNMKDYIVQHQGYSTSNMKILVDEPGAAANTLPTRKNMTDAFNW